MESNAVFFSHMDWACLFVFSIKKVIFLCKCKGPFTSKVKWISLRLKEMQIHACTVEPLKQTFQLCCHSESQNNWKNQKMKHKCDVFLKSFLIESFLIESLIESEGQ